MGELTKVGRRMAEFPLDPMLSKMVVASDRTMQEGIFTLGTQEITLPRLMSMRRARDIRDQLRRLLERVEIELTSNRDDIESIKKAITSGFFPHCARLQKNGSYKIVKHQQAASIHPSSGLSKEFPTWVLYHELVLTSKEYMRQQLSNMPFEVYNILHDVKECEEQGSTFGSKLQALLPSV
ncbi:hypothetical protein ACLB2K_000583 [Fragaria x ananassa]